MFRGPQMVLRRVVLHDDFLEIRRLLRPSRRIPWRDIRGVRIAAYDPSAPGHWGRPIRGRAVEVRLDGEWARLRELTFRPGRPAFLDYMVADPPAEIRQGYDDVRGYWERGGGRAEEEGWLEP